MRVSPWLLLLFTGGLAEDDVAALGLAVGRLLSAPWHKDQEFATVFDRCSDGGGARATLVNWSARATLINCACELGKHGIPAEVDAVLPLLSLKQCL